MIERGLQYKLMNPNLACPNRPAVFLLEMPSHIVRSCESCVTMWT